MGIGADIRRQYTDPARGANHPEGSTLYERGDVSLHVDGKIKADVLPVGCGGQFVYSTSAQCNFQWAHLGSGQIRGARHGGKVVPLCDGSGNLYYLPIPSASGISFGNGGLAADTLYYAYVHDDGGTLAAEWSTTVPVFTGKPFPAKTGDDTRTLVGMAKTDGSSQFVYTDAVKHVKSWWNPVPQAVTATLATSNTTSTTWAVLLTVGLLSFGAPEVFPAQAAGGLYKSVATDMVMAILDADGSLTGAGTSKQPMAEYEPSAVNQRAPFALAEAFRALAAGAHDITLSARVFAGTGDFEHARLTVEFGG